MVVLFHWVTKEFSGINIWTAEILVRQDNELNIDCGAAGVSSRVSLITEDF